MSTLYETRKRHKIFNINNTEITQHDDILAFLKFITQIFEMKKKCSLYNHPKSQNTVDNVMKSWNKEHEGNMTGS